MWVILDDINPAVGHRKNFRNAEQDSLKYILEYLYYWIHLKKSGEVLESEFHLLPVIKLPDYMQYLFSEKKVMKLFLQFQPS